MATATKTEIVTLTLTPQEAKLLQGYLVSTAGLLKGVKEALATAQAPF